MSEPQFLSREGRCYEVIYRKCVTRRNGRLDCKPEGNFKFEVEIPCSSCLKCEEQ